MNNRKYPTFELRDYDDAKKFWDALSPTQKIDPNTVDNIVYRGQGSSEWDLIPSILREPPVLFNWGGQTQAQDIVANEILLLHSFVEHCDRIGIRIPGDSQFFRNTHLDPQKQDKYLINPEQWPNPELLDLMAMAQHHSVPTRLLDWSRLSYTAVYFATSTCLANYGKWEKESKLAVWALNTESLGFHPRIKTHKSAGSISPHLAAQYGLFTVHPHTGKRGGISNTISLEKMTEDLTHPIFFKYTLPVGEAFELLHLLGKAGYSAADIYPSADGAGKAVQDIYNAKKAKTKNEELLLKSISKPA